MRGLIVMQAAAGAARMTKLRPRWKVVASAEVVSASLSSGLWFALLQDPYPHIEPTLMMNFHQ